jgi:superfamily II DNA or RNA helicase
MKIKKITKVEKNPRIVITTWQSAITLQKSWFKSYGMVIGDEAHLFRAKSLNTIMAACVNACYRIGTTGTLDGSLCNERVLVGNFGPTHRVITTKELIDNDTLAALKIKCIVCNHSDELKKVISKADYQTEIDAIVTHAGRNSFIANLALDQKGNTLVLFNLVQKHGKPLFELISSINGDSDRHIFYVSGEVNASDRENIREITDKHTNQTILRFGKKKIKINNDSMVNLSNGTTKFAKDITIDDDVCDKWISAWVQ